MYVNAAFRTDEDAAWDYVAERGFGTVVAITPAGATASQVPLLVTERDGRRWLEFHVARVNPIHEVIRADPRVLVAVSGPDAYISPDWYVSADQVPTWNYLAAHVTGTARPMGPERAHAHVEAMSLAFEARLAPKKPWSTAKMTERRLSMMLAAIVPIEVEVQHMEASTKLGQNKSVADRMEAARMLGWRGGWSEAAIGRRMLDAVTRDTKDQATSRPGPTV